MANDKAACTYIIRPDQWYKESDTRYIYEDDDLAMRVILEENKPGKNAPVWWNLTYAGTWQLKAESLTLYDDDNLYYYDALKDNETYASDLPINASHDLFFGETGMNIIPIPTWLIEHMRYLCDMDAEADDNAYKWCKENNGRIYSSWNEVEENMWSWYASKYVNGGQYDWAAKNMAKAAEVYGYIEENDDKLTVNV